MMQSAAFAYANLRTHNHRKRQIYWLHIKRIGASCVNCGLQFAIVLRLQIERLLEVYLILFSEFRNLFYIANSKFYARILEINDVHLYFVSE